jgi:Signal peptidase (SPase) II
LDPHDERLSPSGYRLIRPDHPGGLRPRHQGALGNYLDRVFRGYVVDFIHVPHWPVFNVADIAVSVGIGLLVSTHLCNPARPRVGSVAP